MIAAGSLTAGSCAGALAGNFTVTGGLYPKAGWSVPNFGDEDVTGKLPPPVAAQRVAPEPAYVGYYPDYVPVTSSPDVAARAARDFDRLYDDPPRYAEVSDAVSEPDADDWPPPPAPSADVEAYSAVVDDAGVPAD